MEIFQIKGTTSTPNVFFNIDKGILIINGRSFPEYPDLFFDPIIEKIKELNNPNLSITFEMDYINTSSSKIILNLLKEAKRVVDKLTIIWSTEEDDSDILELGEYMAEIIDLEFEFRIFI